MIDTKDWLISVDDHIVEPPDLWVQRAPAAMRDRVPRVERIDGYDTWLYDGKQIVLPGLIAAIGRPTEEIDPLPVNYDQMIPACYDLDTRVDAMNTDRVLASVVFPSFPRFCGQTFLEAADKDVALTCLQIYNDWMLDEWSGAAPGRFIPLILTPMWDTALCVAEIERCAAKGAKAIAFSENPYRLGLPSIHSADSHWYPVFAAANDTGMPLCIHLGSSSHVPETSPDQPFSVHGVMTNLNLAAPMVDWLFSGFLQQFPNLKVVLSEGQIGWIPYVLERAAYMSNEYHYLVENDYRPSPTRPSQMVAHPARPGTFPDDPVALFRDHIFGCFIEDQFGARNLDAIGFDNVMVETDFPHGDSRWPNSAEVVHQMLAGYSDEERHKVLQGNAMRVFNFEPAIIE